MTKDSAYEMAIWQAKGSPEEQRNLITDQTNQGLAQFSGLRQRSIYQSLSDPQMMFDWVEWGNLEQAVAAGKAIMSAPDLADFLAIVEKTIVFEHYSIQDSHVVKDQSAPIIELVIYQLHEGVAPEDFRAAYSEVMTTARGYHKRYFLKNSKGENQWAELVHWNSEEEARQAATQAQQNPAIGKAFQLIKNIILPPHFFKKFN